MIKIEVKKMWQGKYVSIREPQLNKAIRNGGLVIEYDNKHMVLNTNELKSLMPNIRIFKSKFGNKPYKLVDIIWKPSDKNLNQLNLL